MKYLLDVNALLAAILSGHSKHQLADAWMRSKSLVVCPISELGFIRISTNPKAYNVSMTLARRSLEAFKTAHKAEFIPDDIPALKSSARRSEEVTDCYLLHLASTRGLKLATLDTGIAHAAAEIIK
jgi:predicted nucleic acid-binding protein